jgi:hypothetical protein
MGENPYAAPHSCSADTNRPRTWFIGRWAYVSVLVCALPVVNYAYVWAFWLLASAALGEWARPHIHDPKIFFFGIPLYMHIILMLLSFAAAPVVLVIGYLRGRLVGHVLAYATCFILSVLLFRMDIQQITTWIAD